MPQALEHGCYVGLVLWLLSFALICLKVLGVIRRGADRYSSVDVSLCSRYHCPKLWQLQLSRTLNAVPALCWYGACILS